MHPSPRSTAALLAASLLVLASDAQNLPSAFYEEVVVQPNGRITDFHVDHHGTIWYALKSGEIHTVDAQGAHSPEAIVDLSDEVANFFDHGLQSFALDPDFHENGYLYLYYVVDWHHVQFFGTPDYDPAADEYLHDTIARVTRYTVGDPHDPTSTVDPASRHIVFGAELDDAIPVCAGSHAAGAVRFGLDGSLLLSSGDGYTLGSPLTMTCLSDGVIAPKQDVRFFAAQLVDSHSGKLLRIDPASGEGLLGNPFYDPLAPDSARSRVYALGLRHPYGIEVRPDPNASPGDVGRVYIGDVGPQNWEELNVVSAPGQNFGWPAYLGMEPDPFFSNEVEVNLDAPNPLFGQVVEGVGLCDEPYFEFGDLIVQDTLNPPSWPNPCDPKQEIPNSIPLFVHRRPALVWAHYDEFPEPTTLVPTYSPEGEATWAQLGQPGSPTSGESFTGNCAVGGHWFQGSGFPSGYDDTFFFADFGESWMKVLTFDEQDAAASVQPFGMELEFPLAMRSAAGIEGLYYLSYLGNTVTSEIRHVRFSGMATPVAQLSAAPTYGAGPVRVAFSSADSVDPAGLPLAIEWDFGDGSPFDPTQLFSETWHVYPSEDITILGTPTSSVDELDPPTPMGNGSLSPAVIRNGIYPEVGADLPLSQYDTVHVDALGQPDKGPLDWTGYTFPGAREIVGAIWQQGQMWELEGGWLEELRVELRDRITGIWEPVEFSVEPPYAAPGGSFNTHQIWFESTLSDGLRIIGEPGGQFRFMSTGELRIFATPHQSAFPQSFTATLTVTDEAGQTDSQTQLVSPHNTPPVVSITAPAQGQTYAVGAPLDVQLSATISDAEHDAQELSCEWAVNLVHDNHVHPEPLIDTCDAQFTLSPHGELLGDPIYWSTTLRVTDPEGLSTTVTHYLLPEGDCDLSGVEDALEIAQGLLADIDQNGIPDVCQIDCDADGLNDAAELVIGTGLDLNGSGRLDSCEPVLYDPQPGDVHAFNDLIMTGGVPGSIYVTVGGAVLGEVPFPMCGGLDAISAGISSWVILGVNVADANGDTNLPLYLPSGIFFLQAFFQNWAPSLCEVSSISSFTWPAPG